MRYGRRAFSRQAHDVLFAHIPFTTILNLMTCKLNVSYLHVSVKKPIIEMKLSPNSTFTNRVIPPGSWKPVQDSGRTKVNNKYCFSSPIKQFYWILWKLRTQTFDGIGWKDNSCGGDKQKLRQLYLHMYKLAITNKHVQDKHPHWKNIREGLQHFINILHCEYITAKFLNIVLPSLILTNLWNFPRPARFTNSSKIIRIQKSLGKYYS